MNVEGSPTATSTKHWLPSHVQITILQARELHLKNKSGPSELYVSLQVDKDRFLTTSVPKQHNPYWNEVFVIPLMSLASTVHVTVRQKGRFGDSYIGYTPLNTGSFKVDPNQVTHWHKLGPKPGKLSTKLRGDLQVSFQFLSKWSSPEKVSIPGHVGGMLKHSSSDMRLSSNMRHTNSDEALSNGKLKNRLRSSIRRSFRRKTKPVVVQTSTDDFEGFVSHSASSTPQNVRKRMTSSSNAPDATSNSVSSASMLSNGPSDSDSISQSSPIPVRRGLRASESEEGSLSAVDREKDQVGEGGGVAASPQDGKMPHASQFYNFRSKKRPFSIHSIPTATPSPASTPMLPASERLVGGASRQQTPQPEEDKGQGQAVVEKQGGAKTEEGMEDEKDKEPKQQQQQQQQEVSVDKQEEEEVTAFKYRPRGAILSKSFRVSDSSLAAARLAAINKNVEGKTVESDDGKNPPTSVSGAENSTGHSRSTSDGQHPGGGRRESGYGTDRLRQSSLSEESSTCNSTEGSRTELSAPTTAEGTPTAEHNGHAKPLPKTHPYSRRIEITPRASSPKVRPRVLKTDPDTRGNKKPRPASLVRRSTLSSIPSGRRLLPATPVRRGQRPSLTPGNATDGKSSLPEDSSDSFAKKLASSLEEVASKKEGLPQDNLSEDSFRDREGSGGESSLLHTSPSGSTNSINSSVTSKEDLGGANLKKHTVQYKNKGASFQPVTLLPPSLSDYTTYSQTLPTRGKHSKKKRPPLSNSTTQVPQDEGDGNPSSDNNNNTHGGTGSPSPSPTKPASNHSPANTKLTPKALIDHMRPPSPVGSVSEKSTDLDDAQVPVRATVSNPGLSRIVRSNPSTSASPTRQQPTSTPSPTVRYGGKTPGEIVTGSLRNRRPTGGGLKKAITMYQENRRQSASGRKLSSEDGPVTGGVLVGDLDSLKRFDRLSRGASETGNGVTRSARTSPQMSRASPNQRGGGPLGGGGGGGGITNLFNTLRRTRSHFFTPSSSSNNATPATPTDLSTSANAAPSKTRHISASDLQDRGGSPSPSYATSSPRGGLRLGSEDGSLSNIAPSLQNSSAPGILMMVRERERVELQKLAQGDERGSLREVGTDGGDDDDERRVSEVRIRIRTATMTSADSAKTLTETTPSITSADSAAAAASSTADSKEHRFSPNPAGAASAACGGSHVRHTTNSSVESEGFHSIMSEDVSMEDVLNQDWTHWSREELIRELISCKEKLVSAEGQLRETKSYMDSLLLRVMETNPSILSAN